MAVSVALDLSSRALPAGAARLYWLMGLFPGARFTSDLAAAAAAVPRSEAECLLRTLAGACLLADETGDQSRFHNLIRLHARETADLEEPAAALDEAAGRIVGRYLAAGSASLTVTPYRAGTDLVIGNRCPPADPPVFAARDTALGWLERELPNVLAAARLAARAGDHRTAWQLADAMWPVFLYQGRHVERLELDRLGLQTARDGGGAAAGYLDQALGDNVGSAQEFHERFDTAERAFVATCGPPGDDAPLMNDESLPRPATAAVRRARMPGQEA